MKSRNIIAIATVMALLAVMAAPFATTVSAAVTPPGIPTTVGAGQPYSIDLRDYLGSEFDPWFNKESNKYVLKTEAPSWLSVGLVGYDSVTTQIEGGQLILSGTPSDPGSYNVLLQFMNGVVGQGGTLFEGIQWTINVVAPDATIDMLVGDTFSYTLEANVPSTFSIAEGDLSKVGLSLSGDTISGTAALGKTTVKVAATSIDGPTQVEYQTIGFNVYRVLGISGTIQATNVDGASYSSQITVVDVDPDASSEVSLSLNQAAIDAGFTVTRGSDTSWALTRTSAAFVSGTVPITITATTSAGGIQQTRTLTGTVESYYNVQFITTPSGHRGTGLNVWLVEGDGVWTYRPEARPAGTTISVSGLVSGITWSGGVLTVSPTAPLDTTTVTITATSPDGYSSTTQVLTITVWEKLVFTSRPSVENIITTVDGRNVTATAQASYYETILWDMGDGTTYEGSETITHEYAEYGQYTITATALHVLGYTAAQSVDVSISPPSVTDGLKDMGPLVAIIGALFVMIMLFAMMRG